LKNKKERYEDLTKDLRELTEKKEAFEKELEILNGEKRRVYGRINQNESQINSLSIDKAKYETRLEEEDRKLYVCENIEQISEDITSKIKEFDVDALESHQIDLEGHIKKLEPVNMRAIDDYQYIVDRYDELFEKRTDYENEEKKYLHLIEEVSKRKKEVFMDVYLKVAENYEKIYTEIGGSGKLSLENPEDPFSGGLLIDASPMNKKLQSLDVMSGGEKSLTALAFLFAIQHLNPAPFYVLDEVDAALDTKNAGLIGEMIKNASKDSQFIVISHREQMISKSDVMYGVCMENGLSKLVGLKI
jgi:chromosome segregation protein